MMTFEDLNKIAAQNDPNSDLIDALTKTAGDDDRDQYLDKVAEQGLYDGSAAAVDFAEKLAQELAAQSAAPVEEAEANSATANPVGTAQEKKVFTATAPEAPNAIHNPVSPVVANQPINEAAAEGAAPNLQPTEAEYVKAKAQQIVDEMSGGAVPTDNV